MNRPRICAVIVNSDLALVKQAEEFADLFELRIDLVGEGWPELVTYLNRPWIACNRAAVEGGQWDRSEVERVHELLKAVELGVQIVDLELGTEGLATITPRIARRAECLLSFHDLTGTPSLDSLREIVRRQIAAGADICKIVTTARRFEDNITVLRLISEFPRTRVVAFAMGDAGSVSRVLCPLVGGDFTYASIEAGKESAPGQITAGNLRNLYQMVAGC
ncbi:type I 3-dehydroquinate dehydratase [Chloroflexota bacterium]